MNPVRRQTGELTGEAADARSHCEAFALRVSLVSTRAQQCVYRLCDCILYISPRAQNCTALSEVRMVIRTSRGVQESKAEGSRILSVQCAICVCVHVIVYIPRLECLLRELERSILPFWFM